MTEERKTIKVDLYLHTIDSLGECIGVVCPDCHEVVWVRTKDVMTLFSMRKIPTNTGVV